MSADSRPFENGKLVLGCNYWASHAGTRMWSDWSPEVVRADVAFLAGNGVRLLRVFPLWPDFQPIESLRTFGGKVVEYRSAGRLLPGGGPGSEGLDPDMLDRLESFCDICGRHGISVIVALINGWMSGRLFVPPAMEGRSPITDPVAVYWEIRLVRGIVARLVEAPAIVAWDLGNECNCMWPVTSREEAGVWTAAIAGSIRRADPSRPILSGMHSLSPRGPWTIQDQAEHCDILTTHPYPLWSQHAGIDGAVSMRAFLHSSVETRMYETIGDKPCIVEETGTMGPFEASDEQAASFLRVCTWSGLARNVRAYLWWCAFDQERLTHPPYDWNPVERELGLARSDRTAKPVLEELDATRERLTALTNEPLPARDVQATCILTRDQDSWGVAFGAAMLAVQAGFEIDFANHDQPLPDSGLYLLPSLRGQRWMNDERWKDVLRTVEGGATLYVSFEDAVVSEFDRVAGLRVIRRPEGHRTKVRLADGEELLIGGGRHLLVEPTRARVLLSDEDGFPVLTEADYGAGKVVVLVFPLELSYATGPGPASSPDVGGNGYYRLYRTLAESAGLDLLIRKQNPYVGVTIHRASPGDAVVMAINYSVRRADDVLCLREPWRFGTVLSGDGSVEREAVHQNRLRIGIPGCDAVVFRVHRS